MASRVELFTVTTPAGTAITAPIVTDTFFNVGEVEQIEVLVPPGNAGLSGFQIRHSGAGVFPREDAKWIIASGESIRWATHDAPTAGRWQIRSYNTDVNDHSVYLRYLVREVGSVPLPMIDPMPIDQPDQPAPVDEGPSVPEPTEEAP